MTKKTSQLLFQALSLALALLGFSVKANAEDNESSVVNDGPLYKAIGKRDPFRKPAGRPSREPDSNTVLQKFPLEQLTLRAILRGLGEPKALFQDPDGKTHIVNEGVVLGREGATVSRILNSDVIVTERTFNYLGAESLYERIISLPDEE